MAVGGQFVVFVLIFVSIDLRIDGRLNGRVGQDIFSVSLEILVAFFGTERAEFVRFVHGGRKLERTAGVEQAVRVGCVLVGLVRGAGSRHLALHASGHVRSNDGFAISGLGHNSRRRGRCAVHGGHPPGPAIALRCPCFAQARGGRRDHPFVALRLTHVRSFGASHLTHVCTTLGTRDRSPRQIKLQIELPHRLQLSQRRQVVQIPQTEVLEELTSGAEKLGATRHIAMADDADPVALHHRLEDVGIYRDATHALDLGASDRLPICDKRERLQQGAGILGRALRPQARDLVGKLTADLNSETATGLLHFNTAPLKLVCERLEGCPNPLDRRPSILVKELRQLERLQ